MKATKQRDEKLTEQEAARRFHGPCNVSHGLSNTSNLRYTVSQYYSPRETLIVSDGRTKMCWSADRPEKWRIWVE